MKHIARLALMILAVTGAAWGGNIRLDQGPGYEQLTLEKLTQPAKRAFTPAEFMPSAMARSFDYEKDGYIGTVRDGEVLSLDQGTPAPETAVPEPATVLLVSSGIIMAGLKRRRLGPRARA